MPMIPDPEILRLLQDPYFDHHAAMHLARQRLTLPNGKTLKLFLPPSACKDCMKMTAAGARHSGAEFLQMHHEMVRVFRFLLERQGIRFLPEWRHGQWHYPENRWSHRVALWSLDDPEGLPHEVLGMFSLTDPHFLRDVFAGVSARTRGVNESAFGDAIDELGRFIERGVDQTKNRGAKPDGSGFHNTMHEYLASREGKSARGAEMGKIRHSFFNDYFWSLHLWIDGQYGRLLERSGQTFYTDGLDPATLEMGTHPDAHGEMDGMSMPSGMSMSS